MLFSGSSKIKKVNSLTAICCCIAWACSSVGRASHLHCGGQGFDSPRVHQTNLMLASTLKTEQKIIRTEYMKIIMHTVDALGPCADEGRASLR